MRAITFSEYGTPDVLTISDMPEPLIGHGMVRVKVKTAEVQPIDCVLRKGLFAGANSPFLVKFPQIPGNEFAGIVDQVDESISAFRAGDEVLGWQVLNSYAEYIVVSAGQLVRKPSTMTWEEAGGFSGAGQTALTAIDVLGVKRGDIVLIHGAAGAVGAIAVQLARIRGAVVIGSASEGNHDYLKSLGAIPVTYGDGLSERLRSLQFNKADVILDAAGKGSLLTSMGLMTDKNRTGTLVDFDVASKLGLQVIRSIRSVERLSELTNLCNRGLLKVYVRKVFPLEQAAGAHREVEKGHGRGKVVLSI
jgi:NADPH:quinone reductase-like Zn-dependent oxidoreductase